MAIFNSYVKLPEGMYWPIDTVLSLGSLIIAFAILVIPLSPVHCLQTQCVLINISIFGGDDRS
jgi:hypothetical protein